MSSKLQQIIAKTMAHQKIGSTITGLFLSLVLFTGLISACGQTTETATPTAETTPTPQHSATPTLGPLGGSDNPVIIGFENVAGDNSQANDARQQFIQSLSTATGLEIQFNQYADPRDLYQALADQDIQVAWLMPLTYIYAKQNNVATVGLLANHFGTYFYGTQFLANVESGYLQYFSPDTNTGTADAQTALAQFDGARPCWVEPGSISGYIYPAGLLEQAGVVPLTGIDTQSFLATIRALYIKGICDFGVTFAISGDPRTASSITGDLPDVAEQVVVIWQSNAEIPNINLSYGTAVPISLQRTLNTTLASMLDDENNRALLSQALSNYDVQGLKIVDNSVYDPLRNAIDLTGTDVSAWIGR